MSPLEPSLPDGNDIGRLSVNVPLMSGWPCRWCRLPLGRVINHFTRGKANEVACLNCDNPGGVSP